MCLLYILCSSPFLQLWQRPCSFGLLAPVLGSLTQALCPTAILTLALMVSEYSCLVYGPVAD